jgi:hypothetical protein
MSKEEIKNILEAYYTPPWQKKIDCELYIKTESEENVVSFIKNMIKPQMKYFIKNKKNYPQREIYVQNVNKALIKAKFLKPKKKKFKYSDWMKELTNPKKTDEEYKKEQKLFLSKTLIEANAPKIEKI